MLEGLLKSTPKLAQPGPAAEGRLFEIKKVLLNFKL